MQLSREELLKAYRSMATIRRFEERVQEEFSKGGIPGFVHLYAGEEASAVGVCAHRRDKDYIASDASRPRPLRSPRAATSVQMMQELFAKEGGLCGGKGGSMHIADLDRGMLGANGIVGGGPPLVVGAALSAKTLKTGTVAVSFTGDGGSNQGTTFEALNMAVVLQLPAIFVFENNQYGEGTGFSYHCGSGDIAGRAGGFGMPAVKVNGDDFFAVHEAAGEAVERARQGGGPSAIEVDTCRFYGHHSGDAQLYRGKDEVGGCARSATASSISAAGSARPHCWKRANSTRWTAMSRRSSTRRSRPPAPAPRPTRATLLTDVYVSY